MTSASRRRRAVPGVGEAVGTFALAFPLSLLLTLAAGCLVPVTGLQYEGLLSFASVLWAWLMMALIGVPSGLVFLLAVLVAKSVRRLPFSVQTGVLAVLHFVPLIAVIRLLESVD